MTTLKECFETEQLKKTAPNKKIALQDLQQAEFFLNEAFDLIELNKKEMASIALYNAVFHAARALLFKDGIREKSHYCLQKYLEEKYEKQGLLKPDETALFDVLRGVRQEIQYGTTKIHFGEDLNELYDKTEQFIQKTTRLVKET